MKTISFKTTEGSLVFIPADSICMSIAADGETSTVYRDRFPGQEQNNSGKYLLDEKETNLLKKKLLKNETLRFVEFGAKTEQLSGSRPFFVSWTAILPFDSIKKIHPCESNTNRCCLAYERQTEDLLLNEKKIENLTKTLVKSGEFVQLKYKINHADALLVVRFDFIKEIKSSGEVCLAHHNGCPPIILENKDEVTKALVAWIEKK